MESGHGSLSFGSMPFSRNHSVRRWSNLIPMSEFVDPYEALGEPAVESADGTTTAWNIFGTTSVPATINGRWYVKILGGHSRLILSRWTDDKVVEEPVKKNVVQLVGENEEVDELVVDQARPVLLPRGTTNVTVTLDDSLRHPRLFVRGERQSAPPPEPPKTPTIKPTSTSVMPRVFLCVFLVLCGMLMKEYMKMLL